MNINLDESSFGISALTEIWWSHGRVNRRAAGAQLQPAAPPFLLSTARILTSRKINVSFKTWPRIITACLDWFLIFFSKFSFSQLHYNSFKFDL